MFFLLEPAPSVQLNDCHWINIFAQPMVTLKVGSRIKLERNSEILDKDLACRAAIDASRFECPRCKRSFPGKQGYADLTVLEGAQEYADFLLPGTEIFR